MSIVIWILTFFLVLTSFFLVLIVLAQKAKSDGGVGAAMGGGVAEAAFGAETSNVLTKLTIYASIAFFILSLVLYLARLHQQNHGGSAGSGLPTIPVSAAPVLPAAGTPAATAPSLAVPAAPAPATPAPAPTATTTAPAPAPTPASDAAKKP
ncbi:MAG TPA: preprotein translocase subunit SecG [Opitutaceae bacterium]|nr:preprotein translocase subunit SecG [Opitutaceae bacterium]